MQHSYLENVSMLSLMTSKCLQKFVFGFDTFNFKSTNLGNDYSGKVYCYTVRCCLNIFVHGIHLKKDVWKYGLIFIKFKKWRERDTYNYVFIFVLTQKHLRNCTDFYWFASSLYFGWQLLYNHTLLVHLKSYELPCSIQIIILMTTEIYFAHGFIQIIVKKLWQIQLRLSMPAIRKSFVFRKLHTFANSWFKKITILLISMSTLKCRLNIQHIT